MMVERPLPGTWACPHCGVPHHSFLASPEVTALPPVEARMPMLCEGCAGAITRTETGIRAMSYPELQAWMNARPGRRQTYERMRSKVIADAALRRVFGMPAVNVH